MLDVVGVGVKVPLVFPKDAKTRFSMRVTHHNPVFTEEFLHLSDRFPRIENRQVVFILIAQFRVVCIRIGNFNSIVVGDFHFIIRYVEVRKGSLREKKNK